MGQATSSDGSQKHSKTVTNDELMKLFTKACLRQFQPIELVSIQANMNFSDRDRNSVIDEFEFQHLLSFPEDKSHLLKLVYNFITAVSQFPLINHKRTEINYHGLLRAITLLSSERCSRVLTKQFDYVRLIFASLAIESSNVSKEAINAQPDTQVLSFINESTVSWPDCSVIETFDGIDLSKLYIPASNLLEILTMLLLLSRLEPQETLRYYTDGFRNFEKYKPYALSLLRSMNPDITKSNINSYSVNYQQFSGTILNVAPNLLDPLSSLLESLLYTLPAQPEDQDGEKENEPQPRHSKRLEIHTTSRLINEFSLSQLSTFLPKELVYSNIRKLYVGSDSGFSMRSFESKVFKWNAPTIVLLKGARINSERTTNPRYKKFQEDFPNFKTPPLSSQHDDDLIIYGIYVDQPWRITNKEYFASDKTMIFQISPVQKIFKAGLTTKKFVYFNTLGGGIGIGSSQPIIKNNFKRYQPGNVSLTIDSTLEFGVFRHLGIGGEFRSIDSNDISVEYEDRFLINDVEVWGCGGEKELEEQNKRWDWEQKEAKRRQQINLKSLGEDRAILEMAGLVGQNQSGGSV